MPDASETKYSAKSGAGKAGAVNQDLLGALKDCQRVLHDLGRPPLASTNIQSVWAQCIAAELRARQAILRAEGGQ